MMRERKTTRKLAKLGIGVGLAMTMALPVGATPGEPHTITICHVTNSDTNPFVVIEVDVAAFDGVGENDHTQHVDKDGHVDLPYIDGECGGDDPN